MQRCDNACALVWQHILDLCAKPDELRVSVAIWKRINARDPGRFLCHRLRRPIDGLDVAVAEIPPGCACKRQCKLRCMCTPNNKYIRSTDEYVLLAYRMSLNILKSWKARSMWLTSVSCIALVYTRLGTGIHTPIHECITGDTNMYTN